LYYESDSRAIVGNQLLTDVMRTTQTPTEPTHTMELRYENGAKVHSVTFTCLLPSVSVAAQVGEIVTASVQFTVNGPLTTATLD